MILSLFGKEEVKVGALAGNVREQYTLVIDDIAWRSRKLWLIKVRSPARGTYLSVTWMSADTVCLDICAACLPSSIAFPVVESSHFLFNSYL